MQILQEENEMSGKYDVIVIGAGPGGYVTYDYGKIVAYKEETTDKLVQGVEQLLKANGVDVYEGKGTLLEEKKVRIQKKVEDEEDSTIAESTADDTVIEGKNIILASGSKPLILPIPGMDNERVLTSDALFAMKEAPRLRFWKQCQN